MKSAFRPVARPLAIAIALLGAQPAFALKWDFDSGVSVGVDTTLSYGFAVRMNNPDPALVGIATTLVNPPAAAAAVPVAIDSL